MTTDSKGVARWDLTAVGENTDAMLEVHDGDYVLFTDHERVVGELAHLNFVKAEVIRDFVSDIETLRTALAASRAEVDGLKKDADRYRWLRNDAMTGSRHDPAVLKDGPTDCCEFMFEDELDEAIDAAMEKGNV